MIFWIKLLHNFILVVVVKKAKFYLEKYVISLTVLKQKQKL